MRRIDSTDDQIKIVTAILLTGVTYVTRLSL